jgi:hypothetical protein
VEDQGTDEARYHQTSQLRNDEGKITAYHLPTATSAIHEDRRLVPGQYGPGNHEVYEGSGGLSSAVVDVARLCAMFSCRMNNPVLSPELIDAMMDDAVKATKKFAKKSDDAHGYHGFDGAAYLDQAKHQVKIGKGGSMSGVRTAFRGVTGGMIYVLAYNGNPGAGADREWYSKVKNLGDAIDWKEIDLFPEYDMPSFPSLSISDTKMALDDDVQFGVDMAHFVDLDH